jgi:hypothetical protein
VSEGVARTDDGKAFNDPTAWGYCDYCAFMVAIVDGVRLQHPRVQDGAKMPCAGSGFPPVVPAPRVAAARKQVSLRKDANRAQRRRYWQRQRWEARLKRMNQSATVTLEALAAMGDAIADLNEGDDDGYDDD